MSSPDATWPAGAVVLVGGVARPGQGPSIVATADDAAAAVRAIEATGARTAVLRHRRGGDRAATLDDVARLVASVPQVGYVVVHPDDGRDLPGVLAAAAAPPIVAVDLPPHPAAAGAARAVVRRAAGDGVAPAVLADVELVVSELATNAVLHGRAPFRLGAWRGRDRLHLAVEDAGTDRPRPRRPGDGEGGRGLVLVDRLSICWGVAPRPGGGKVVWADVPLS
jgi:anti-sigma regulatory factor (Ser/Thr protein kinase)